MSATNDPAPASGASLPSASSSALGPSSTTPVISTVGDSAVPSTVGTQVGEEQVARGAFVVLEGLDRSGKTTQVKLLQSRLIEAGRRVQLMRFPGEFRSLFCFGGGVFTMDRGRRLVRDTWIVPDAPDGTVSQGVEGSRSGPMKEAAQVRSALPSKIRAQEGASTILYLHMLASPTVTSPPGLIGPVEAIPLTSIPRPHNPHGPDNKSVPLLLSHPPRPVDPPPLHRQQVGGGPQHRRAPGAGRHRRLR